ncbi:MAG: four helix bundle protein [Candidatus Cloacimonas sp.]|jgi:four helix bundle protein|nr:four helix bundle protein [Candidatus Cloacimonas sp.]
MLYKSFKELIAWQEARAMVTDVYKLCNEGICRRDYGYKDQIQRAAVSIMSNIAEGFGSGSDKAFIVFLSYSYRSSLEVESLLYVALDLNYINAEQIAILLAKDHKIQALVGGLIRHLKSKST